MRKVDSMINYETPAERFSQSVASTGWIHSR